jgi:hypothetical protein
MKALSIIIKMGWMACVAIMVFGAGGADTKGAGLKKMS